MPTAPTLLEVCEKATRLPCSPALLPRLITVLEKEDSSIDELESVIRIDTVLASSTLRLANSAYFAAGNTQVENLSEAIMRLGQLEVYRLAALSLASRWMNQKIDGYRWEAGDFCRLSLMVAVAAEYLATQSGRVDPKTARIEVATDALDKPNGICFSPDYKKLYVVDTGDPSDIRVFNVADNKLSGGQQFTDMKLNGRSGGSDGIRADVDGNIWAGASGGAGYDGVHVFSPHGQRIGMILLPEICANVCFGGAKHDRLFMAASTSLYALYVGTQGALRP